jgi:sigma-B regulation protein RsbU (phosphoserine phosphatase)
VREKHKVFSSGTVSFLLRSAGHVGGDLVGYYPVSANEVGFFAIDVSGHGISSALMTARLSSFLTSHSPDQNIALIADENGKVSARPPSDVVTDLNRIVLNEMETDHYFTVILAHANLETGDVTLCQAGHPHPLVQRKDGSMDQSGTGGLPVGLFPDAEFDEFQIKLDPGDRLILSSDGITECPSSEGSFLGEDGFERLMKDLNTTRGPQLLETIIWLLSDYAGDDGFPDDVSAVLFEFDGIDEAAD